MVEKSLTKDPELIERLCCGRLRREVVRDRLLLVRLPLRALEVVTPGTWAECGPGEELEAEYSTMSHCPYSNHKLDERRLGPLDLPLETPRGALAPVEPVEPVRGREFDPARDEPQEELEPDQPGSDGEPPPELREPPSPDNPLSRSIQKVLEEELDYSRISDEDFEKLVERSKAHVAESLRKLKEEADAAVAPAKDEPEELPRKTSGL
jgi:hypothetical protein